MLNPTDLIEVQCLLDGSLDDLQVECRVVGVRSVEQVKLPRDSWDKVWRVSTGDVVMLILGPLLAIGVAVGLFLEVAAATSLPGSHFCLAGCSGP